MKIAIVGAGFTGLSAGYRLLQAGHSVTIFERDPHPGGLALGFRKKEWAWTLEEYYHHWFTNDAAVLSLAQEIGHDVITRRPKTSTFVDGKLYQLDSPLHVLTFPKLPLVDRIRMGGVLGFLKADPYWKPLEKFHAEPFLRKTMGDRAYETIWEPQMVNKYGNFSHEVSLAWFWARIKKRTPSLVYPTGGFLAFAEHLSQIIEEKGGTIHFKTGVGRIEKSKNVFRIDSHQTFDKVIVTLPTFLFLKLYPDLPEAYKASLTPLTGLGAQALVLRLSQQFLTDNTYWLSICDKGAPVMAVVEHTNFMDKKYYNNEHIVYLGNYLPTTDKRYSMTKEELLRYFTPFLKQINPAFHKHILGVDMFKTPFAQPIIPINYSHHVPPLTTPVDGLYLANIQQVYPWDRGTNYAVAIGNAVAQLLLAK